MERIPWSNDMCVGVEEIDRQHERMTAIINKLYYAFMHGEERELISGIIDDLERYAKEHFATEEKYMVEFSNDYEDYELHMSLHEDFFAKTVEFLFRYVEGEDIAPELLDYLVDWWRGHINGIDRKLGCFLNERGVM